MPKRQLQTGDQVQFESHDEKGKPCKVTGFVAEYIYPHFHPYGYVRVVNMEGQTILEGNADSEVKKVKNS